MNGSQAEGGAIAITEKTAAGGGQNAADAGSSWKLASRIARRELRTGVRGFRIFIACLALGVGAIAAVGSVSSAVTGTLTDDARSLLGGDLDIRIIHRPAEPEMQKAMEAAGDVSRSLTLRTMGRASEDVGGERRLVEVKAVDDLYPLYGQVVLDPPIDLEKALGNHSAEPGKDLWGAVIDPRLPEFLGADVGDRLHIGAHSYEIRAKLVNEPDKGGNPFSLGPRVLLPFASMESSGLLRPGSLYHYHYKIRLNPDQDLLEFRTKLDEEFPDAGWRVHDYRNASPGVKRFVDRITLFLTLVGLTALLTGGVGVSHAVRSFLASKTGVIATLKCLGAPARLVQRVYTLQILAISAGAVLVGLVVGGGLPFVLTAFIGEVLPFPLKLQIYPGALAIAATFGLLTAFVFSLWPLVYAREVAPASLFRDLVQPSRLIPPWKNRIRRGIASVETAVESGNHSGVAMTQPEKGVKNTAKNSDNQGGAMVLPRWTWKDGGILAGGILALIALALLTADNRMLAAFFILAATASMLMYRGCSELLMAAARRMSQKAGLLKGRPGLRFALASLHRPGAATGGIVMSLGLGLTVLVAIASIQGNLVYQIVEELPDQAPTFFLVDLQPDQLAPLQEMVDELNGAHDLVTTPMVRGRIMKLNGTPIREIEVDPDVAWALRGDRGMTWSATPPEGTTIREGQWWDEDYQGPPLLSLDHRLMEGFGLKIGDSITVNILGRDFEAAIGSSREINWSGLSMNFTMVFAPGTLDGAPHSYIATVKTDNLQAEDRLFRQITDSFTNVSVIPVREALETVEEIMGHIALAVRLTAAVTLIAGTLVLAGAIAAGHQRRVRDAVILKVLGARRWRVIGIFLIEYGLLAILTALIASVTGSLGGWAVITGVMHMDWTFQPGIMLVTLLLCAAITLLAGLAGTWRALGQKVSPLLRNE